jgi:DNA-binding NarL/FixJ family response regulator
MIRVAIVAGSSRLQSELEGLLRERAQLELVASVSAHDGLRAPEVNDGAWLDAADVVVTDACNGIRGPNAPAWVLLSDDDEPLTTLRPLRGGFALLPMTATADQIVAAIEATAAGLAVLHPDHASAFGRAPCDDPLTPREREVLHMLAAGLGNKEIAARLAISDHTAKFHVSQILAKLNAGSRTEAVSLAMRRGMVPL